MAYAPTSEQHPLESVGTETWPILSLGIIITSKSLGTHGGNRSSTGQSHFCTPFNSGLEICRSLSISSPKMASPADCATCGVGFANPQSRPATEVGPHKSGPGHFPPVAETETAPECRGPNEVSSSFASPNRPFQEMAMAWLAPPPNISPYVF
jgi:hypothetical protein